MRTLSIDELENAALILSNFEMKAKERLQFPKPLIEMIRGWLEVREVKVGVKTTRNDTISGFAIINLNENQIMAVYADDLEGEMKQEEVDRIEVELLDWCFLELDDKPRRIELPVLTKNAKRSLLSRGYSEFERVGMVVKKEPFAKRERIPVPEGFVTESYTPEKRVQIAEVIARANEGHTDAVIYPEFFSSQEAGIDFLNRLEEGELGEHKDRHSKVLLTEGKTIGYCILTVSGGIGVIHALGVLPEFQSRGLGKMLLVNTILDLLESEESIKAIGLAVTVSNPARHLYEKQGFKICDEFSSIAYTGK